MPIRRTTTTIETNINVVRPVELFVAALAAGAAEVAGPLAASEGESTRAAGAVVSAKAVLAEAGADGAAMVAAGFRGCSDGRVR